MPLSNNSKKIFKYGAREVEEELSTESSEVETSSEEEDFLFEVQEDSEQSMESEGFASPLGQQTGDEVHDGQLGHCDSSRSNHLDLPVEQHAEMGCDQLLHQIPIIRNESGSVHRNSN